MSFVFVSFVCVLLSLNWIANTAAETASYGELQADEFMKKWLVLGPIPVSEDRSNSQAQEKQAFDSDLLTQHGGETSISPKSGLAHQIGDKEYQWQFVSAEGDTVDLVEIYGEKEYVIAYAWAELDASETMFALLAIGSDDAVKVWLNGELVHENWVFRPLSKDEDLFPVEFQKGKNQLLLKIQNERGDWGFACRMLGAGWLAEGFVSAAEQGELDNIKLLLAHEVDINLTIGPGLTALHAARISGQKDVANFLLEKGADPDIEMPSREKIVDMLFGRAIKENSPGAALVVTQDGSVIYKNGYGSANMEYDIPITPSTIFHVASVSKQFTAFAVVMLADQGKLSLDDDIRVHLPEVPDFGKTITIRHLIHHTSGLRDQWELLAMAGWRLDDVITKEHIMKMVRHQKELNFDPGEEYLYCNTGYTLLAEIVVRVSGQSFREYTKANIFKPLGMSDTHFHDDHEMIVKNRAYSYEPKGDGAFEKSVLSYANVGATSLFTTVEDLAKWMQNFHDGRVGGMAAIEQMHQRGVLNNGEELGYAFGLFIGKYRGLNSVGHGGGDAGYRSNVIWFPDQKFGVVVLSNLGTFSPGQLARQVADVYLMDQLAPQEIESEEAEPAETTADTELYDDYVGLYQAPGVIVTITKEDNRLMGQVTGIDKEELLPESETTFFAKAADARLTFQRDEAGGVTHLIAHQGGQEISAERIENSLPAADQLDEFVGDYYSDELGTIYTMVIQKDQLVAQHRRHEDIPLTPTATDQFAGAWNAWWFRQVSFERDENQKVTGFRLTGGRVRNMSFDSLTASNRRNTNARSEVLGK